MLHTHDAFWFLIPVTGFFAPLVFLAYFVFRVYCIVTVNTKAHHQVGLAWCLLVGEFFQFIPALLLYCNRVFVLRRPRRPRLFYNGNDAPGVDVLITACGEDNDLISNVVQATCVSDWPSNRLHVILLDDGNSEDLRTSMKLLQEKYPWVYYTRRDKPEVPDYKAGNLNYGLRYSAGLPDGPFPFIAGLDADMIAQPHWLRVMMPHLLRDPKLAMTCPPQYFYNIPKHDRLRQDLDYFYDMTELIHDGLGAGDCIGSGYLVRREAIDMIEGFPTYSIAEDTGCSSALNGQGWGVAYIEEALQCGEMPDTLIGHIKQRTRWTIGNVQTAIRLNFRLWGPLVPKCSYRQRLAGFVFGAGSVVDATISSLGFVWLPLALISGYPLVVYHDDWQLSWLLRLISVYVFLDSMHKAAFTIQIGYRDGMRWGQADSWLIPYYALSFLRGFVLPLRLGGTKPGFVASGSISTPLLERRPGQSSLSRRMYTHLFHHMVWFHALFIMACALGVVLNIVRCFDPSAHIQSAYDIFEHTTSGRSRWVYLLTRIGWPPLPWLSHVISCCIPIEYIVWPPRAVTASDALMVDEKTGVRYPKPEYWGPNREGFPGRMSDHWSAILFVYTVVCFAGSWYVEAI